MLWLQDPKRSSIDNLNNVRCAASSHFRNKNKEYLKAKINFKLTVRAKRSDVCIGASMTLRRVTGLESM